MKAEKYEWRQGQAGFEWYSPDLGEWVQWEPGHPRPPAHMIQGKGNEIQGGITPTKVSAVLATVAGALIAIGCFLPWLTLRTGFGSQSLNGLDDGGDGLLILPVGIFVAVVGISGLVGTRIPTVWRTLVLIAGVGTFAVTGYDHSVVTDRINEVSSDLGEFGRASVGTGIWVLYLGAGLAVLAGIRWVVAKEETVQYDSGPHAKSY